MEQTFQTEGESELLYAWVCNETVKKDCEPGFGWYGEGILL